MGHTNSTTYYNLPQFLTSDKPAWLTDINNAMSDIDSGLHAAQADATTAGNNATQAISDASAASTAAAAADAKGAGACASIEAAFDSTAVYGVGTKVMYNSLLYRCTVAVTTPGPWTGSANWERITVNSIIPATAANLPLGSDFSDPTSTAGAIKALETASVTITPSTGVTLNYSSMGVNGKLVACSLITKTTFTAGTWKEIGYISKVPTDEVKTPCVNNSTGIHAGMARIETTGKVAVYPIESGEYAVDFSMAYITT